MSQGFIVQPAQLQSHSSSVGAVASAVEEAASAAATERMGGLVYGLLFDGLALPFLNMWADSMHSTISQNAEVGQRISEGLAANAETYAGIESANTSTISQSGQEV